MKLEVSATAYENIISELCGIVYLLHCIAPSVQDEEGKYAYHGLLLLRSCVERNAKALQSFMNQPPSNH